MIAIPLVVGVIAFGVGLYLTMRLTDERGGPIVDLLGAAAAAAAALTLCLAVRAATADVIPGYARGDAIAYPLIDALWQAGLLIAAAAVVRALAGARHL